MLAKVFLVLFRFSMTSFVFASVAQITTILELILIVILLIDILRMEANEQARRRLTRTIGHLIPREEEDGNGEHSLQAQNCKVRL
jgi:hypothetical protein